MTKSQGGSARWWRNDSRARRLSLFRSTARFAARRETVRPSRAAERPLDRARTVKKRSLERVASANTRPNSAGVCNRWSGENPAVSVSNGAPKRNPLRRQASAALRAPAGKNFSTGAGGHAGAEAMRTFTVQIAGLKSSLHARYPARAKVLAKTRMWDGREAAHCTRPVVALSTASRGFELHAAPIHDVAKVVDNCGELS